MTEVNPISDTRTVTLLLPALDEAEALPKLISEIPKIELNKIGWKCKVLLVDGGSTDSTIKIAKEYGCKVIKQGLEKGKGAGMRIAFDYFLKTDSSALVMIDADGTYSPEDMMVMLNELNKHDVVIGSRLKGDIEDGAMTRFNFLGNHMLSWTASILYGKYTSDLCSGAWAFKKTAIEKMNLNSVHFEIEAEMFANCAIANLKIGFVPINYRRRTGEPKLGSIRDGASIFRKLFVRRVLPANNE